MSKKEENELNYIPKRISYIYNPDLLVKAVDWFLGGWFYL